MNNTAIILGAGSGTRMKCEKSKLLLELDGATVIERSVRAFFELPFINNIIVVCREEDREDFSLLLKPYGVTLCIGGSTRQRSVKNALKLIDNCDCVFIHDGARPLITAKEIEDTYNNTLKYGASAVGVPVKDTIKVVDGDGKILDTPDRSSLISIRTPQVFEFSKYKKALESAENKGLDFTDDCAVAESYGISVYVTPGEYDNIKITTPEDLPLALSIISRRESNDKNR